MAPALPGVSIETPFTPIGAQRVVDKVDPVGAIEESSADVAAGLAAIAVIADERIVDEGVHDTGRQLPS